MSYVLTPVFEGLPESSEFTQKTDGKSGKMVWKRILCVLPAHGEKLRKTLYTNVFLAIVKATVSES